MEWPEGGAPMHLLMYFALPLALLLVVSLRQRRSKLPFPPGPPGLPVIGNMLIMDQLNHRGLARLGERYGGLCHLRIGFVHNFAVSTPEMARQVLQVQDNVICKRPTTIAMRYLSYGLADMAFANYGPFWRQMRKLCVMKLFSRQHAESWSSVRDEVDSSLRCVAARAGSAVNLRELVLSLMNSITFRAAFGMQRAQNQGEFIAILQEFSNLFVAFNVGDFMPWLNWMDLQGLNKRLRVARRALDVFIDKIIDEHLENPKDTGATGADMVDEMLVFLEALPGDEGKRGGLRQKDDIQGGLKLTRDNIKAIIMDIMFGGTETVAVAIEWTMSELMKDPDELKKVQQELADVVGLHRKVHEGDLDKLSYLKCAVKETLRLHPPFPILLHETSEDCEVEGYAVPARSRVMINVWAIGRDRSAWKDADAFRPSRFAPGGDAAGLDFKGSCFEFLPFGSGRRSCPGMQLGLYALELAVAQLLHCFEWSLPDGADPRELDMGDMFGLTAPRTVRLVAVPTPRLNCALF